MKFSYNLLYILVILISISLPTRGKRVLMFPLSPREVYRLLKEAGREDAIPQGRVVTQGMAAVTGFALGLAKGIGGTVLGAAALSALNAGGSSCGSSGRCAQQTQEVCFTSRSLNEIYDDEEEDVPQGRQDTTNTNTTPITSAAATTPTTTQTDSNPVSGTGTNDGTETIADVGDGSGTITDSTTQTGTGGSVNCLVIQQPPPRTPNRFG